MKIVTSIIHSIITLIALCIFAPVVFAYAPQTTHAGLTQEIVGFYEAKDGAVLSADVTELIVQGAIDEDSPDKRSLNHFYDPVRGTGFNDNRSSLDWATNDLSGNEFTWGKGIEAYVHGDEQTAMMTLGHILHLIEDASVPDHTRNDPHKGDGFSGLYTGESPFEYWTNLNKDRGTLTGLGEQLFKNGNEMNECDSITNCFQFMASYSNGNFFSRDTISLLNYIKPEVIEKDSYYAYGIDELTNKKVKLYKLIEKNSGGYDAELARNDDYSVIIDYFDRLAPQVVSIGARVIDLYMTEAKFARAQYLQQQREAQRIAVAEQVVLNEQLQNSGFWGQLSFGFTDLFFARPIFAVKNTGSKIALASESAIRGYTIFFGESIYTTQMIAKSTERASDIALIETKKFAVNSIDSGEKIVQETGGNLKVRVDNVINETTTNLSDLMRRLIAARMVLGQLGVVSRGDTPGSLGEIAGASTTTEPYVFVPDRNTPSFGSGGGGGNGGVVIFLADSSVSSPPPLPEATTTETNITPIDITAPDAPMILKIFSGGESSQIQEFTPEYNLDDIHLATTSATISGTAEANVIVAISWLADTATIILETRATTTGEWSTNVLLPLGTTTISAVAIDEAGNVSSSTLRTVVVTIPALELPVLPPTGKPKILFNEIAWSGTEASSSDEWIELFNAGDAVADLSQYRIDVGTSSEKVAIPLFGMIGVGEYFVFMKNGAIDFQGKSIQGRTLDMDLPDTGADLTLVEATTDGDVIHDSIPFCVYWCGKGDAGISMERWRIESNPDVWSNWGTNNGNFVNALDRNGSGIIGTPGTRNSLNYALSLSNTIEGMQTFARGQGAYVIFTTLTVPVGSSLTFSAGTVVKFDRGNEPRLIINGALVTEGTTDSPVIFTSLEDDSVLGDTLNDGASKKISPTNGITIIGASSTAELSNTEFHHFGFALILNNGASTTLATTTISNGRNGIVASRSTLVSNNLTLDRINFGGISASNGTLLDLASTSISNAEGGGIGLSQGSKLIADGLTITDVGNALRISRSFATITDAIIDGTAGRAVSLSGYSVLSISSSTISNSELEAFDVIFATLRADDISLVNNQRGIYSRDGDISIHNSVIEGNTIAGITNTTSTIGAPIDATGNYWGDVNGPTLPGVTASSTGDSVTTGVLTEPFLAEAPI